MAQPSRARVPDYSSRPTLIIGAVLDRQNEPEVQGVTPIGFTLPKGLRIIVRDYAHGPEHTDGDAYEDRELDDEEEDTDAEGHDQTP